MAHEVKLPQLGESVTEGTITAWLVDEGEEVSEDQPLFEISTDKIDTEVPSPASGVLKEIRAQVDDTIEVGEVVAIIDTDGEAAADGGADDEEPDEGTEAAEETDGAEDEQSDEDAEEEEAEEADEEAEEEPAAEETDQEEAAETDDAAPDEEEQEPAAEEEDRGAEDDAPSGNGEAVVTSPIVRKLIREHDLDPSRIEGSGRGGRITREDVEKVIEGGGQRTATREPDRPAAGQKAGAPAARKPMQVEGRSRTEQLSRVRKAIAKGMWESLQTTAQLTAVVEVDVTGIMKLRAQVKREFEEREGVALSPFPFFARAVCMVLPQHDSLNAAIDTEDGTATFYDFVNLGIAVDAPQGLFVPNVKNADDLTIGALARAIADLADRTRNRKLNPDEVTGATFTLTNTGSRGVMLDTPILNPPEVGILATTKIEKRPVVVTDEGGDDAIAIRWMTYLCLTYDHRMVDGADAARFLTDLKEVLETHDFGPEVGA